MKTLRGLRDRWSSYLLGLSLAFWLTGPVFADQVAILDTAFEALEGRIHILESADRSIDVLYFAIHDDEVTRTSLGLLREKALQGIRVRIITNPRGFKVDPALKYHLQTLESFEIRIFDKPVAGRFKSLRQLHDKLILVDGDHYITGGRNLGASYFDLHETKNKKDRDIYVIGASASIAQAYFDELWNSQEVSLASFAPFTERAMAMGYCESIGATQDSHRYKSCKSELEKRQQRIEEGVQQMESLVSRARDQEGYRKAMREMTPDFHDIEDRYVSFVHDHVEDEKVQTAMELGRLHRMADRSILVQTPYWVPSRELMALLESTHRKGIPVEVVTNSVVSTINLIATAGTERYQKRMLDAGVTFHEFTGDRMLHAKSMVYRAESSDDGGPPCWAVIGSFNIDPRSMRLNTETLAVVRDCAFADEHEETIRLYTEPSVRVASREDLPASKALKKEIPFKKRFLLATLKLLTPLYRSQI